MVFRNFYERKIDLSLPKSLEKVRRNSKGDNPMTHHIWKWLALATLGCALPLSAQDSSSIRAALASKDYAQAFALSKQAFANVNAASEATALTRSILASAPAEQIPELVVAAIAGNPDLRQVIIKAAIDGVSKEVASAILAEVAGADGKHIADGKTVESGKYPVVPPPAFVATDPIYDVLTMPWFNPANSIGVVQVVIVSPSTPSTK
jgi:hypothetical protein